MVRRETFYAELDGKRIACARAGDSGVPVIFSPSFVTHIDMLFSEPVARRFVQRLAEHTTSVYYDKLGSGLSDPVDSVPTLEDRVDELVAVMDAAGLERAAVIGISEGTTAAMGLAAMRPDRVTRLVLLSGLSFKPMPGMGDPDADLATVRARLLEDTIAAGLPDPARLVPSLEQMERLHDLFLHCTQHWGDGHVLETLLPGLASTRRMAILERSVTSREMATASMLSTVSLDSETVAQAVSMPTFIFHSERDVVPVANGRRLHALIAGSTYVEHPSRHHAPWISADGTGVIDDILEFLTGEQPSRSVPTQLASLLFCDIVDSTAQAARLGDDAWNLLIERFEHECRHAVEDEGGVWVKSLGDGFMARFAGPVAALQAAAVCHQLADELDIELRQGVHAGAVEVTNDDAHGLAVNIAARICAAATPGHTFVSRTVQEMTTGSGVDYQPAGTHQLKGIDGDWDLLAVGGQADDDTILDEVARIPTPHPSEQMRLGDRLAARIARVLSRRTRARATG